MAGFAVGTAIVTSRLGGPLNNDYASSRFAIQKAFGEAISQ
jgi:hypothetical protein